MVCGPGIKAPEVVFNGISLRDYNSITKMTVPLYGPSECCSSDLVT